MLKKKSKQTRRVSTLTINDSYMSRCSTQAYCSSIPWEVRISAGKQRQRAVPAWDWILSASVHQLLEAARRITLTLSSFPSFPGGFMTGKVAVLCNSPSTPISSYKNADPLTTHVAHLSIWFQIHQRTQKESHYWSPGFMPDHVVKHTQNSATKGQDPNWWTSSRGQNKTMSSVNTEANSTVLALPIFYSCAMFWELWGIILDTFQRWPLDSPYFMAFNVTKSVQHTNNLQKTMPNPQRVVQKYFQQHGSQGSEL